MAPRAVWDALTKPEHMQLWMSETPLEIITDWKPGSAISISGPWYKTRFINTGTILACEPEQLLIYTHLSSLSRLDDVPENHAIISFRLVQEKSATQLTINITQCANEGIYNHLAFYWNVALEMLRKLVTTQADRY